MYASASAFAPICSPTRCPWGTKAFEGYLGSVEAGRAHDAVELINGLSSGDGLELQRGESARLAVPQVGFSDSSGRAWGKPPRVRHQPLQGCLPPPWVLEPAGRFHRL